MKKICIDCKKDISDRGNRAVRCEKCQTEARKKQKREFAKKYYADDTRKEMKSIYQSNYIRKRRKRSDLVIETKTRGTFNFPNVIDWNDPNQVCRHYMAIIIEKNRVKPKAYADIIKDVKKLHRSFIKNQDVNIIREFVELMKRYRPQEVYGRFLVLLSV